MQRQSFLVTAGLGRLRFGLARISDALHHDFCPWANRYVYWLKRPIGWFVLGAAASLLIGISTAPQALVVFAAILAVMALGVTWPWIAMRGVSCGLSFERRRTTQGTPVRVQFTVVNRWPWPLWGLMIERGFWPGSDGDSERVAISLARIAAWSRTTFEWEFRPERRGRCPYEAPRIASGFPFGIWYHHRPVAVQNELLVWPRTVPLTSIPPIRGRSHAVACTLNRHAGDDGDLLGVRPFRPGDSLRHVHWNQTAKHDRFVVCERQATGRRRVHLIVDPELGAQGDASADQALERLIRAGASIARQFHAHSAQIALQLGRRSVIAEPGEQGLKRIMDAVALWSPRELEPDDASSSCSVDPRLLVVVVTAGSGARRRWSQKLAQHRDALVVVLADDAETEDALEGRCDEVTRSAAAARGSWLVLEGRDDALSRLARGWERLCHDGWSRN
jgi:uncharacterized protein (DUF58 family)